MHPFFQVILALFAIGFCLVLTMCISAYIPRRNYQPPVYREREEPELVDSEGMLIPGKMWKGFSLN